jgi:hypothetical protein
MRGPSSPRGWLNLAVSVRDRQERPYSVRYEYTGYGDRRTSDIRETGISVLMLAERASHSVCRNGVGYKLLLAFYVGEASWWSFTEPEQSILRKTARRFAQGLREAGFLPKVVRDTPSREAAPEGNEGF